MMICPDISQWQFNRLFGMGDKEWNRKLRMERRAKRVKKYLPDSIEYWNICQIIGTEIQKQQEARRLAAVMKEKEEAAQQEKMEE